MSMPPEVELCTRARDGHPCLGRIFRPTPEVIYCPSCGGNEAGVVYSQGQHPASAVRQFHEAFGAPLGGSWFEEDRRRLRRALIREEFREYRDAEDADDPAATLDALVDLAYVIIGAALEYGWDFAGAFDAVHAANMAKLGPDGKPILRADGKVLKPEGWKPADLTAFLGESCT